MPMYRRTMNERLRRAALLVAALAALWLTNVYLGPWVQRVSGFGNIDDPDVRTVLGHWVFWQGPRVVACGAVWLVGLRLGLMPSLRASLGSGGSWRRVAVSGLIASVILLALTIAIVLAVGGELMFQPYVPKMIGDLASNMYEEIVYRGLIFCAFYGVAAAATFPLDGKADRLGLVVATIGSCAVFAAGHTQYPVGLRVMLGVLSILFVYPWVKARSLWAPWIPHTLVDVIGDSILKL